MTTDLAPRPTRTGKARTTDARDWLLSLAMLCAGNMSRQEAEMRLKAYAPMLADQFPPGVFTQDSLHAVASACKWFPSYAEVIEHLRAWWRDNRPYPVALPPPPPAPEAPPPTPEQLDRIRALVRATAAELRSAAPDWEPPRPPKPRYLTPEQIAAAWKDINTNP